MINDFRENKTRSSMRHGIWSGNMVSQYKGGTYDRIGRNVDVKKDQMGNHLGQSKVRTNQERTQSWADVRTCKNTKASVVWPS